MLLKLAVRNMRRSLRDYAIYFITLLIAVTVFYAFNSVGDQQVMHDIAASNNANVIEFTGYMMNIFSVIVALVLVGTYRAFPPAVEVGVRLAPHLGTGIFPQDGIDVKRFAPGREQRRELVIGMRLQGARSRALEIEHRSHASILSDAPAGETARLVVQSYAI